MAAAPVCRDDSAILQRADGTPIATFTVEIADDAAERERGLMQRPSLPKAAGMLFVYPSERPVAFWMHDTLIPLDIIFLDGAGRVISVQAEARPLDDTPLPSQGAAQYVLEINGGLADRLGIGAGTVLSHPAIAAGRAAIPCR